MPKDPDLDAPGTSPDSDQPPPPDPGAPPGGGGGGSDGGNGGGDHDHGPTWHDHQRLYEEMVEVKRILAQILQEAREEKLRKKLEYVPVRTSDLMRGFQAAVARANRSTVAGDVDGEDIERMSIKDLEVTLSAPIIDGGHAEDPVVMLPNIKSVDAESAKISLKFSVVSVPLKGRG